MVWTELSRGLASLTGSGRFCGTDLGWRWDRYAWGVAAALLLLSKWPWASRLPFSRHRFLIVKQPELYIPEPCHWKHGLIHQHHLQQWMSVRHASSWVPDPLKPICKAEPGDCVHSLSGVLKCIEAWEGRCQLSHPTTAELRLLQLLGTEHVLCHFLKHSHACTS